MNSMDNAKVIETLEKFTAYNYLEKLLESKMRKLLLFSVFPITGAPNFSDPHFFVMVDDISKLISLNCGRTGN